MKRTKILAVDFGNTTGKVAITIGDELGGQWYFPSSEPSTFDKISIIAKNADISGAVVSSVIPAANDKLTSAIGLAGITPIFVNGEMELPIRIEYGPKKHLGADRILDAVGAHSFYGDKASTIIVIDAGSAITVDIIENGIFLGGAIMPGISMMFNALAQNTALLPKIKPALSISFPGKSTNNSIKSGVTSAIIGGIEFLVKTYNKRQKNKDALIVITGGDADKVSNYLKWENVITDKILWVKGAIAIFDFTANTTEER